MNWDHFLGTGKKSAIESWVFESFTSFFAKGVNIVYHEIHNESSFRSFFQKILTTDKVNCFSCVLTYQMISLRSWKS
jgi:hypothetical protein